MIVFAAFTPHSPLLLPDIGKEHSDKLAKTRTAMDRIAEDLYASRPETLILLSSHGAQQTLAFSLNLHDRFHTDFSDFGSHVPERSFRPDIGLIDRIQRHARREGIPLKLHGDPALDYGSGVPLALLTPRLPELRIVQVSYANALPPKLHAAFGASLRETLLASDKRIGIIASGDLSHALAHDAPAGARDEGTRFDALLMESLDPISIPKLLAIDPQTAENAAQCAYLPTLILAGILERMRPRTEILSYEHPFGVGYLTAQFHLK